MADLGLNTLNDDQLLDLLVEACAELGQRDPVVRNLAQKQIYAEAERVKAYKAAICAAVKKARSDYEDGIRKESREIVEEAMRRGEWHPLTSGEEGKLAAESEMMVRHKLVKQAQAALSSKEQKLWLAITASTVAASYTYKGVQRESTSASNLTTAKVDRLIMALKEALGV